MLGRMAARVPPLLRNRVTVMGQQISARLEERGERFLDVVERGVYGHPASPYLPLLQEARCELGDLRAMVRERGVEDTLTSLREAGVYVRFEEFKGREPIERNGRVVIPGPRAFDNPLVKSDGRSRSSGSTGTPTQIPHNLYRVLDTTHYHLYADHVRPDADRALALPPSGRLTQVLRSSSRGTSRALFEPMGSEEVRVPARRLASQLILRQCACWAPVPFLNRALFLGDPRRPCGRRAGRRRGKCQVRAGVRGRRGPGGVEEDRARGVIVAGGELTPARSRDPRVRCPYAIPPPTSG
jgi:hypothetical protein